MYLHYRSLKLSKHPPHTRKYCVLKFKKITRSLEIPRNPLTAKERVFISEIKFFVLYLKMTETFKTTKIIDTFDMNIIFKSRKFSIRKEVLHSNARSRVLTRISLHSRVEHGYIIFGSTYI